jgi:ABC-2 type transport system permease protein
MPLMFLSAAFAPLGTMPDWLRTVAAFNPVAHAIDSLRGNVLGTATPADTAGALAAAAALWLVVALFHAGRRSS